LVRNASQTLPYIWHGRCTIEKSESMQVSFLRSGGRI
jgi:hypothetical protein